MQNHLFKPPAFWLRLRKRHVEREKAKGFGEGLLGLKDRDRDRVVWVIWEKRWGQMEFYRERERLRPPVNTEKIRVTTLRGKNGRGETVLRGRRPRGGITGNYRETK